MKLTQVKGNTYVLEGWGLIPLYKTDESHCILLDTGLRSEREEIESTLEEYGLTPVGILNTHAHLDHAVNNRYFQEKYAIPVAMPQGEAALCSSLLTLKCYYFMFSPDTVRHRVGEMLQKNVLPIGAEDGPFAFAGVMFHILHTPGHAPDHICIITPDDVCYLGDALLTAEPLKFPYGIAFQPALDSLERLRKLDCPVYVAAHRGIFTNLAKAIDHYSHLLLAVADHIRFLISAPMTEDEICRDVCEDFQLLSSRPERDRGTHRTLRAYLEFLLDRGEIVLTSRRGVLYYGPAQSS